MNRGTDKEIPVPRIRGNTVALASGRFGYELQVMFGEMEPIYMGHKDDFEGFETRETAISHMKEIAQEVCRVFCDQIGVKVEGFYDLTKNKFVKDLK